MAEEQPSTSSVQDYTSMRIKDLWLNNPEPYKYISSNLPDIEIRNNRAPLIKTTLNTNDILKWEFTVYLKNETPANLLAVNLISPENRDPKFDRFFIAKVTMKNETIICEDYQTKWENPYKDSDTNTEEYFVYIHFNSKDPDVYRTNIFFDFGMDQFIIKRLCVDCSEFPTEIDMTEKQKMISNIWTESSYETTEYNVEEKRMSKIYPFPKDLLDIVTRDTFVKMVGTKADRNFRGAMHEILYLKEILENEIALETDEDKRALRMIIRDEITIKTTLGSKTIAKEGELYGEIQLKNEIQYTDDGWTFINKCNYVRVKIHTPEIILKLQVIQKSSDKIYVKLIDQYITSNCCIRPDEELLVDVQTVVDRLNYCNWHLAVDAYKNNKLNIYRLPNGILDYTSNMPEEFSKESQKQKIINAIFSPLLTESLDKISLSSHYLTGSYGSGKKFLIAHVIRMLVQLKFRVLLCTSSNTLADYYIRQYFHVWYNEQRNENIKPIRIYNKRYPLEAVHETVLNYCLKDSEDHFCDPNDTELLNYNIIVTTLENLGNILYKRQFISHLIIEEAHEFFEWNILDIQRQFNIDCHKIYISNRCNVEKTANHEMWASSPVLNSYIISEEMSMTLVNCMHPTIIYIVNIITCGLENLLCNDGLAGKKKWDTREYQPLLPLTFYDVRADEQQVHTLYS